MQTLIPDRKAAYRKAVSLLVISWALISCENNNSTTSTLLIKDMDLKRGDLVICGPSDLQFGSLSFDLTGTPKSKEDFLLGLKLLHSFEYDEAEKVFARIIDKEPQTPMAYWGVAMANFHALWAPPTEMELIKGAQAIEIGKSLKNISGREKDYLNAIEGYYKDYQEIDHRARCLAFEKAMERLRAKYPEDKEASVFYALALNAAAEPTDKSFSKQKKAGDILNALYPNEPDHPGIVHYIIHTYDVPELAEKGLQAARRYASVAPSSAHALHMPSHIFTRLGLWEECIKSNLESVSSAQCYANSTGIKGHWDEELHGLDYLMYAYLQRGENNLAGNLLSYLDSIKEVHPSNVKVAYAFAAMPSRYVLENRLWNEASLLKLASKNFSWEAFPWQKAIVHFARSLGGIHTGRMEFVKSELDTLKRLHHLLVNQKDSYKAGQVEIQIKTVEAWMLLKEGKEAAAVDLMKEAASLEDKTGKHPVTPGEVIPARELLADLFMEMNKWPEALQAYEESLRKQPNRFNGLLGAGIASEKSGNHKKAKAYFEQLIKIAGKDSKRSELKLAKQYLKSAA